jgi:hypothetical protein
MTMTWEQIAALNVEMGEREFARDRDYFEKLLGSAFAMQRANPDRTIVDRATFLADLVKSSPKPRTTQIDSISVVGQDRLVVTCIVTMDARRYHNLRIFVRSRKPRESDPEWLLLAWVNEPLT